jgi:hypothetical protein
MTFTPFSLPTDPNSQILLGSELATQVVQDGSTPLAVLDLQNRPGWYYNSSLPADNFVWTIFNGTDQNYKLGDVQNLTFTATHDNLPDNKCYIAISSNDSKIVYENDNVDLIPGEKCLFYTNTIPSNPDQLRLVQLNSVTNIGPCLNSEQLLTITLEGTNAVFYPNVLQVCVENIGYLLSSNTVPVISSLITNTALDNMSFTDGDLNTNDDLTHTKLDTINTTITALNNKVNNATLVDTQAIKVYTVNSSGGGGGLVQIQAYEGSSWNNLTSTGGDLNTNDDVTHTKLDTINTTITNKHLNKITDSVDISGQNVTVNTIAGFALETTLSDVKTNTGLLHADTVHTQAIQVEVKNTDVSVSGTVNSKLQDGNGTIITSTGSALDVNVKTGSITTSLPALNYDAFGRFRVSNPFTLFDSNFRYSDNGLWAERKLDSGRSDFNSNQGLMDLTVTATTNSQVIRETYRVFSYQPGKSLLVMNSFVGTTVAGVQQRIGYYGAQNGFYFQINGDGTCSFVKRSYVTNVVVNTPVDQSAWNGDKLNSTGPSGYTLYLTKPQLLWMDFEWLGVGTVRCGFVINEKFILCNSFNWANDPGSSARTYMTTASLPCRCEIINTGGDGGTLKQICSTVISEGGYELSGTQLSVATPLASHVDTKTTAKPIISLRLNANKLDAVVIMTAMNIVPAGSATTTYYWQIFRGGTTTGGTWNTPASPGSSVDCNLFPTEGTTEGTIEGGICMASGFFTSTNQAKGSIELLKEALFRFQLLRNGLTGTAIELTVVCSSATATNASVFASVDWEEITR